MAFDNSVRIRWRPVRTISSVCNSASSASVCGVTVMGLLSDGGHGTSPVLGVCLLVRHCIENDVDSQGISLLLREFAEVPGVLPFSFPAVPQIGVMTDDDHHPPLIIEDAFVVNFLGIRSFP